MSDDLKEKIVSYYQRIKKDTGDFPSFGSMAKIFGIQKQTIFRLIKRFEQRGSVQNAPRGLRPKCTTGRQDRQMLLDVKRNPFITAG